MDDQFESSESNLDAAAALIRGTPETDKAKPEGEPKDKEEGLEVSEEEVKEEEPSEQEGEEETQEEGEEEASEEEADEDINVDEIELDVTVDGEVKKMTIAQLKAAAAGEGAVEKRIQEATEIRNKTLEVGKYLYQTFEAQNTRLKQFDEILKKAAEPQIDWERLRLEEPGRYLLERDKAREAAEQRQRVQAELDKNAAEQVRLEEMAYKEQVISETKQLVKKMPDLADPKKAKPTMDKLVATAAQFGYSEDEVSRVLDHRAMLVLDAAAKWFDSQKTKSEKKGKLEEVKPRPLLKAGKTNSNVRAMSSEKKLQLAARKQAMASGKPDDIAKLLVVRKKA